MKIAPLKVSDPWFGRIVNDATVQADTLNGVPMENTVEMELVELLHAGPEGNYRPYLHLRGELVAARPAVALPYGVDELVMRRGGGLPVDAFYDFNQEQLVQLVGKGYFSEAFSVPDEMSGIPWTLPGTADFLVVAPALSDQPPLVFMHLHDQNEMELTEGNSGYELAAYFPDVTDQAQVEAAAPDAAQVAVHDGPVLDIFSDRTFDEHRPAFEAAPEVTFERAIVPDGVFSRLVAEIQTRYADVDSTEAEPEALITPGSAADIYESRVAPGVEHVLSDEYAVSDEESAAEESPEVPLSEEGHRLDSVENVTADRDTPEADKHVVGTGYLDLAGDAEVEHAAAAQRRQTRLRAEIGGSEAAGSDESQPEL